MVYSNRFVACVLVNGQPQSELVNGVVPLHFNQEYSLRFRNKHNRRAVVKFTIDDENVSGDGYVIAANSSIDIHRHFNKDARFKFVSLDSPDAVDAGKNGPNNGAKGVIEAKFYLEKEYQVNWYPTVSPAPNWSNPVTTTWPNTNNPYFGCIGSSYKFSPEFSPDIPSTINLCSTGIPSTINITSPIPQTISCTTSYIDGCTVEGSLSGQNFTYVHINLETDYVAVRMVLKGVAKTAADVYCAGCGSKRRRRSDNFCPICGQKFLE